MGRIFYAIIFIKLMTKQKSRTYARNRSKSSALFSRKGRERIYENDGTFFLKLVISHQKLLVKHLLVHHSNFHLKRKLFFQKLISSFSLSLEILIISPFRKKICVSFVDYIQFTIILWLKLRKLLQIKE